MLYLTNCYIIDSVYEDSIKKGTVAVSDEFISGISAEPPHNKRSAQIIDLEGCYILPGLWDVHTHPGIMIPDPSRQSMFETQAERTIRAYKNVHDALHHGITSLRVNGEADYIDVALREAQICGQLKIPRLFVAGKYIRATGGHGSYGKVEPLYLAEAVEADGPDAVRKAARQQLKMGADHVKIFITGGIAGDRESMYELQLNFDEIQAAVEVAHNKGVRVASHTGGAEAVKTAVKAGVDSIEHGYHLDEEAVALMAKKGTFYVPTLSVTQDSDYIDAKDWPDHMRQKVESGKRLHLESFKMALQGELKIASGSDLTPIGPQGIGEVIQLVRAGMTSWEAIVAATRISAELCQREKVLGTIEVGKLADIIAVEGNPLEDIEHLRKLRLVMQGGQVVYDKLS